MITIIKPGVEKVMKVFYRDKSAKFHLRNISRMTELNENSVSRFLNQLEKDDFLVSERDGNLKKYSIKRNELVFGLFALFDLERFSGLAGARQRAVNYFLDKLIEKPIIVFLFGSSAKGTYKKDSDVDLVLVVNKKIVTKDSENFVEIQTGIRVNVLQIEYEDFLKEIVLKEDNVLQSAMSSGYPLTNHVKYYSEVLR
jgi:predicted nucleotidyltransferase